MCGEQNIDRSDLLLVFLNFLLCIIANGLHVLCPVIRLMDSGLMTGGISTEEVLPHPTKNKPGST